MLCVGIRGINCTLGGEAGPRESLCGDYRQPAVLFPLGETPGSLPRPGTWAPAALGLHTAVLTHKPRSRHSTARHLQGAAGPGGEGGLQLREPRWASLLSEPLSPRSTAEAAGTAL